MSVSTILTSLESQVATTLGADWSELNYVYDLEANDSKTINKRYGIGVGSGNTVAGTTKAATYDFNFFVVLTRSVINKSSDSKERAVLSEIYDEFKNIDINVFQKKLFNASVLVVSDISYDEPEKLDSGAIAVRVNFIIKFREQTS